MGEVGFVVVDLAAAIELEVVMEVVVWVVVAFGVGVIE